MNTLRRRTKPYDLFLIWGAIAMMLFSGCGGNSTMQGPIISQARQFMNLEFRVSATKAAYNRGEEIPLTFTVKNLSAQTINATASNAGGYVIEVRQEGERVWYYPTGGGAMITPISIASGETKTYEVPWNQKHILTNAEVASGQYTIRAWLDVAQVDNAGFTETEAATDLAANPIEITIYR